MGKKDSNQKKHSLYIQIKVLKDGKSLFLIDKDQPTVGNISLAIAHLENCKRELLDQFDKSTEKVGFKRE